MEIWSSNHVNIFMRLRHQYHWNMSTFPHEIWWPVGGDSSAILPLPVRHPTNRYLSRIHFPAIPPSTNHSPHRLFNISYWGHPTTYMFGDTTNVIKLYSCQYFNRRLRDHFHWISLDAPKFHWIRDCFHGGLTSGRWPVTHSTEIIKNHSALAAALELPGERGSRPKRQCMNKNNRNQLSIPSNQHPATHPPPSHPMHRWGGVCFLLKKQRKIGCPRRVRAWFQKRVK